MRDECGPPQILEYQVPSRRPWSWRRLRPTRKQLTAATLVLLFITLCYLRWPRIPDGMSSVSRSVVSADGVEIEYRMRTRFDVGVWLQHSGCLIPTQAKQQAAVFQSRYDLIRGEHYVRLKLTAGATLDMESDGVLAQQPWPGRDPWRTEWNPPNQGVWLANGIGIGVVRAVGVGGNQVDVLVYAGTNVPKP